MPRCALQLRGPLIAIRLSANGSIQYSLACSILVTPAFVCKSRTRIQNPFPPLARQLIKFRRGSAITRICARAKLVRYVADMINLELCDQLRVLLNASFMYFSFRWCKPFLLKF